MTGDKEKFYFLVEKDGGQVMFGGKNKGQIIDSKKVGKNLSNFIDNVLLVKGLEHNFLSISQLCDKGYKVIFYSSSCEIIEKESGKLKFIAHRIDNVYLVDLNDQNNEDLCFVAKKHDIFQL